MSSQVMEMDELNRHDCMASLIGLINHLINNKISPQPKQVKPDKYYKFSFGILQFLPELTLNLGKNSLELLELSRKITLVLLRFLPVVTLDQQQMIAYWTL